MICIGKHLKIQTKFICVRAHNLDNKAFWLHHHWPWIHRIYHMTFGAFPIHAHHTTAIVNREKKFNWNFWLAPFGLALFQFECFYRVFLHFVNSNWILFETNSIHWKIGPIQQRNTMKCWCVGINFQLFVRLITVRYTAPVETIFWKRDAMKPIGQKVVKLLYDMNFDANPIILHIFSNGGAYLYQHIDMAIKEFQTPLDVSLNL